MVVTISVEDAIRWEMEHFNPNRNLRRAFPRLPRLIAHGFTEKK
jgi:hypothetical protein